MRQIGLLLAIGFPTIAFSMQDIVTAQGLNPFQSASQVLEATASETKHSDILWLASSVPPPQSKPRRPPPGSIPNNGSYVTLQVLGACDNVASIQTEVGKAVDNTATYCVKLRILTSMPMNPEIRSFAVNDSIVDAYTADTKIFFLSGRSVEGDLVLEGSTDQSIWWLRNITLTGGQK